MKLGVIMQMQDFFKDARYKRAYSTISFAFFVFLVEISIYEMLRKFEIKQYWLLLCSTVSWNVINKNNNLIIFCYIPLPR